MENNTLTEEDYGNAINNGCRHCRMMFDLFCGKSCKNVSFDEFHNYPYKPSWCEGQEYSEKFHD